MVHWNNEKDASQRNLKDRICAQVPIKMWKLTGLLQVQKHTEKLHCIPVKHSLMLRTFSSICSTVNHRFFFFFFSESHLLFFPYLWKIKGLQYLHWNTAQCTLSCIRLCGFSQSNYFHSNDKITHFPGFPIVQYFLFKILSVYKNILSPLLEL